jgi:hypothetical protein
LITGNGRWLGTDVADPSRFTLVTDVVRSGTYAAKVEVHQGDSVQAGERAEVQTMLDADGNAINENENSGTQYITASIRLPANFVYPAWMIPLQLHGPAEFGAIPSIALFLSSGVYQLLLNGGDLDHNPCLGYYTLSDSSMNLGKWTDFILGIKFAIDTTGAITVWRRNEGVTGFSKVMDVIGVPTLQYKSATKGDHYWKCGLYRQVGTAWTNTLHVDCVARQLSYDVAINQVWGS